MENCDQNTLFVAYRDALSKSVNDEEVLTGFLDDLYKRMLPETRTKADRLCIEHGRQRETKKSFEETYVDSLIEALTLARNTFEAYASLHRDKGTVEGKAKATLNQELAIRMDFVLRQNPNKPESIKRMPVFDPDVIKLVLADDEYDALQSDYANPARLASEYHDNIWTIVEKDWIDISSKLEKAAALRTAALNVVRRKYAPTILNQELQIDDPDERHPLLGKYAQFLEPFLFRMNKELHANSGKGDRPGWLSRGRDKGLLEIYYHVAKLQKAVKNDDKEGVKEYSADVANMSMMLADICGVLVDE